MIEKVSVVIPVYNVENYLNECVDSVINQTYSDLEILLIDDGSTDSSGKMCDALAEKDERIIVVHKENGGLSDARNVGLLHAEGKYVYFLDSDDYIVENAIEKLVNCAEENNSEIVFFEAETFFDSGASTEKDLRYKRKKNYGTDSGPKMICKLYDSSDFYTCVPMMFYKKIFIDINGLRFYKGILHEDNLFSVQAFLKADVVSHCNLPLYYRRMRDESIMTVPFSKNNFLGYLTCIVELTKIYDSVQEENEIKSFLRKFICSRASMIVNDYFNLPEVEQNELNYKYQELKVVFSEHGYFGHKALKRKLKYKHITKLYKRLRYGNGNV